MEPLPTTSLLGAPQFDTLDAAKPIEETVTFRRLCDTLASIILKDLGPRFDAEHQFAKHPWYLQRYRIRELDRHEKSKDDVLIVDQGLEETALGPGEEILANAMKNQLGGGFQKYRQTLIRQIADRVGHSLAEEAKSWKEEGYVDAIVGSATPDRAQHRRCCCGGVPKRVTSNLGPAWITVRWKAL